MSARKNTALEKRAQVDTDDETTARVVDSLVLRGDISALTAEERTRYYVQMCESLGLNPTTQPFALLRLNGKEILYPTKGATDQLAAIHRITREIVDGPRLIDLNGTKLVYALCRATHPNGRIETATATVPFTDPVNVLMKAETKAKRRATLSMLGLGMLDETELETIPTHMKSAGTPIHVPGATSSSNTLTPGGDGRAPALEDGGTPTHVSGPPSLPSDASVGSAGEASTSTNATDPVASDPSPGEVPAQLTAFHQDVSEIELPGEAVGLWIKYRPELATLDREAREAAWKALCKRTEEVGGMKNAKVWLKKAIAVEDARRGKPENDQAA